MQEDYSRIMDTNVKGTFFVTQAALAPLRESRGSIVNISSEAGLKGNFLKGEYDAIITLGAVIEGATQ